MKHLISLLTLLWLAAVPAAFAAVQDDFLVVVQGQKRWIPFSELLGNDIGFYSPHLSIVEGPNLGSLEVSVDGFNYLPPTAPLGIRSHDRFTYTVSTSFGGSAEATVTIRLLPRRVPVIGDFYGDTELELGYYRPAYSDFRVCPFREDLDELDCQKFHAPGHPPSLPMVGSWHGVGYDEIALYDPVRGAVSVLGRLTPLHTELDVTQTLDSPANAWPVPGINDFGFVFWAAQEGRFILVRPDASSASFSTPASDLFEEDQQRPVTRRGNGRFGLANTVSGEVAWIDTRTSDDDDVFDAMGSANPRIFLWFQDVHGADFWGFFNTLESRFRITPVDSNEGVTLLIDIPDDPD